MQNDNNIVETEGAGNFTCGLNIGGAPVPREGSPQTATTQSPNPAQPAASICESTYIKREIPLDKRTRKERQEKKQNEAKMAPDRSNISFTITHMNANHQDSLAAYLQVYCHVSAREAKSARLEDITLSDLVISANGTRYTVPIDPAMGSFSESRSRLVAMHQECLARLGRSDITIKEYRRPEGIEIFLFFVFATALVAFSRRSNFLPGSLFYETVGLGAVPPLAQLFYKTQPFVLTVMAGSHVVEASLFTVKRLKRHGVPVLSLVWCAWVVSNLIEGYTVWRRFDWVVRQEGAKREHGK
ncbi:hypothetical protein AnigIFM59636_000632 [Aspergillus niger]|uniref:Contig An01c0080, genomic contig n=4 Tax=Aspergillus niger TaxID=5061 RepID=A2Q858_ASPNC|nr:uncharacterized protein An01g03150 [Aspergillus niger]XP_025450059.1 uncharacterized protein BO96DRAFT_376348 [Aspergillus niger CBS 101883]PYH52004.1 hypothetical protein BO96DRAFT_376348 [Aspergillus niger CBS 101883]CAK43681.1 unnamed protein product [Aspergillus niger]GJP94645.1 integral membrane protein [Aspergillus niger]GKZ89691.1 hypothetical protein AnigIFM59636_000632 [Aspergillus niger]